MKIIYTITGLGIGGAEKQVIDLANILANKGNEVIICCLKGEMKIKGISNKVKIEFCNFERNPLAGFKKMINIIKINKADVVHSHMVHANIITRLARLFIKIPTLISTAHSKNEGGWLRMRAYQFTDFLSDILTNVSQEAVNEFIKKKAAPKNKIITVYNGIDTEKFSPNQIIRKEYRESFNVDKNILFIAAGRLVAAKDYPNMLHAFAKVCKDHENLKLLIIGDGPQKEQIKILIKNLHIEKFVFLLGIRHDVEKIINAADYFLLSSAWEGFGLVVAEAMSTEKIVIATDCGGVSEVIGNIGFICPPNDSEALYKSINNALSLSEDEKSNLGALARKRIKDIYSIEETVNQWINIYKYLKK